MLLDHLGRPSLTNGSRRGGGRMLDRDEEKRLRVESFARNSTMSLVRARTVAHTHTHTHTHTRTHTLKHTHTHGNTHTHTYANTHTRTSRSHTHKRVKLIYACIAFVLTCP